MLSMSLHAAVLTWLDTLPFRFAPGPMRIALSARLVPAPAAREPAGPGAAGAAQRGEAPQDAGASVPHRYFTSREVDVPAAVLEKPPLIYPEDPYIWKLPGKVRVRVFIGEDGRVDSVELVAAEPPGFFENAALEAARALRYRPAEFRGRPVRSQKLIEIEFDPHEAERHGAMLPR